MNKIIEQIKAIKGIRAIEAFNDNCLAVFLQETTPESKSSLSINELVDGEIYCAQDSEDDFMTFRFKSYNATSGTDVRANCYSNSSFTSTVNSGIIINDWCCVIGQNRITRNATNDEKKTHIRGEIEHGYYHELRGE